ncbi:hypothetical protein LB507_011661 [Fusarium sp. FIESC RH6]|nr:hypothetical protein LB507_011661 [Fusarium sp. FIESC RH6]
MDVTASTLNRTSPLDFDFAKIQPFVKSGAFLEPLDTSSLLNDSRQSQLSKRNNRYAMRFSSNAGIIEQYARSWSQDLGGSLPLEEDMNYEQLVGPTSGSNTPRWPFINDDSLNTPDSVEPASPLFPTTTNAVSQPRQIHRIDQDLEDWAALYVSPLDAVPEATEAELPPPPPARLSFRRSRNKVMTSAEFEQLRKQRAREEAERRFYEGEDEEDKIDYEGVDEAELVRKQMAQRKKQQAHLDNYRQRMMKSTKGPDLPAIPSHHSRKSSSWSMNSFKTFRGHQEEATTQYGGDDDEDDVPLAILQMQRRSGGRSDYGVQLQPGTDHRRQQSRSPLPAFANGLPQNPYAGAMNAQWPMNNQQLIPGGLVGVIASEERAKARRRVAPSHGFQPLPDTNNAFNWASSSHKPPPIPGAFNMPAMQPPMPYSRPQTPVAMPQMPQVHPNNQMFNFIQAQTDFLRSMATMNQQRGGRAWDQQSAMGMGMPGTMPNYTPSNYAPSNYASSNYAPSNYAQSNYARSTYAKSTYARSNYAKSVHNRDTGYAPSVAPSERNTIGMPSRYRPVSKMSQQVRPEKETPRVSTSSNWNRNRNTKADTAAILEGDSTDSEDDEAFWRAKMAKRDRRRAMWIQENDLGIKGEWII